jgi:Zn-dependent protease with chaperone function
MRLWGDAVFNLLVNSLLSFWLALGLSLLVFRAFRLERSRLGLLVLLLPFVKVLLELGRGVPAGSFFWLSEHGARQTLGTFRVGVGVTALGPAINAQLWADHAGGRAPQSLGDLALRALRSKLGSGVAALFAVAVLTLSLARFAELGRRRVAASNHARGLARRASLYAVRRVDVRVVRVLVSSELTTAPFAAGVFAPFVLLPRRLVTALAPAELQAVILHELAHIARFDAVLLCVLEGFERVFWYVPGLSAAVDRVFEHLERRADDSALAAGVAASDLARALLTAAELSREPTPLRQLGMAGSSSVLKSRLERLLETTPARASGGAGSSAPRRSAFPLLRAVLVGFCAVGVLRAVALGNHGP